MAVNEILVVNSEKHLNVIEEVVSQVVVNTTETKIISVLAGDRGVPGPAPLLTFPAPATGNAGTNVGLIVTGDNVSGYNLALTIPRGNTGATGPANTLAIGTITNVATGGAATANITGTAPNQTLSLGIPIGATGPANTLTVGTVTALTPASAPTVGITGTAPTQTINFGIPSGAEWLQGAVVPATGTGIVGDWYINTATSDYYEKTGAAVWTLRGNLKGLTGNTGPAPTLNTPTITPLAVGAAPTIGMTGTNPYTINFGIPASATWFNGTAPPATGTGIVGDYYLVSSATGLGDVYKKTAAATWTLQGNIRGAAGTGSLSTSGTAVTGNLTEFTDTSGTLIDDAGFAATDVMRLSQTQTITGAKTFSVGPVVPDASWTIAKTNGLQAALDGKSATSHTHALTDASITGILPLARGGTGNAYGALPPGAVITAASATTMGVTAAGTAGQFLRSAGAATPTWASPTTSEISGLDSALALKAPLASPTFTGTFTSTGTTAVSGGSLQLTNATSNMIFISTTNGVAPPSVNVRSAGTKFVLYPSLSASEVDFAFGVDGSTFWSSVPSASSFKWYGTTSVIATLGGTGNLSVNGTFSAGGTATATSFIGSGASLTGLSKTQVGLGNVDNTSDAAKPVSTATQTALNLKANAASPALSGAVTVANPAYANDTSHNIVAITTGSDGTLGPLQLTMGARPSATGANRYGYVSVGDSQAMRSLILNTNGTGVFGSVGIGTTSPSAMLHVAGEIKSTSITVPLVTVPGGSNGFVVTSTSTGMTTAINTYATVQDVTTHIGNVVHNQTLVRRRVAGSDWTSADTFEGIGVDASFLTPGTIRTYIRRDPSQQIIALGSSAVDYLVASTTGVALSGGTLALTNATGNNINYGEVGVGAPVATGARNAGTKLILWGAPSDGTNDYALGVASSILWTRVAGSGSFKWYHINTEVMALTGSTGALAISGGMTAASFSGVGTALTALNASNLGSGTVPQARTAPNIQVFNYTTGSEARPTGTTYVMWRGPAAVTPTNAIDGDSWEKVN